MNSSSTVVRQVNMTAMIVGPNGAAVDKVAEGFMRHGLRVLRVTDAVAACERCAVAMPQVVIVLGTLRADERDALNDRATAVGALTMYVDPELDQVTVDELVARAAQAALERQLLRDESGPAGTVTEPPPGSDEGVDEKW